MAFSFAEGPFPGTSPATLIILAFSSYAAISGQKPSIYSLRWQAETHK
jgi:hypothetical protein